MFVPPVLKPPPVALLAFLGHDLRTRTTVLPLASNQDSSTKGVSSNSSERDNGAIEDQHKVLANRCAYHKSTQ